MEHAVTAADAQAELDAANKRLRERERGNAAAVVAAGHAHPDGQVGDLLVALGTAWLSAAAEWPGPHRVTQADAFRWGPVCKAALAFTPAAVAEGAPRVQP